MIPWLIYLERFQNINHTSSSCRSPLHRDEEDLATVRACTAFCHSCSSHTHTYKLHCRVHPIDLSNRLIPEVCAIELWERILFITIGCLLTVRKTEFWHVSCLMEIFKLFLHCRKIEICCWVTSWTREIDHVFHLKK